jgi:hypothetical protein
LSLRSFQAFFEVASFPRLIVPSVSLRSSEGNSRRIEPLRQREMNGSAVSSRHSLATQLAWIATFSSAAWTRWV